MPWLMLCTSLLKNLSLDTHPLPTYLLLMVTLRLPSLPTAETTAYTRIEDVAKAVEPLPADRPTAFALFFVAYENMRVRGFGVQEIIDIQMMLERDRVGKGNAN